MYNGDYSLQFATPTAELANRMDFQPQLIDSWLKKHHLETEAPSKKDSDIPKVGICWAPFG